MLAKLHSYIFSANIVSWTLLGWPGAASAVDGASGAAAYESYKTAKKRPSGAGENAAVPKGRKKQSNLLHLLHSDEDELQAE